MLSRVLHAAGEGRGGSSSPALMNSGPTRLLTTGVEGWVGGGHLFPVHADVNADVWQIGGGDRSLILPFLGRLTLTLVNIVSSAVPPR